MDLVQSAITRLKGGVRGVLEPDAPPSDFVLDEFLWWLRFASAGVLHSGNIAAMDRALRDLPSDAPILEIGSFAGLSTNAIGYLRDQHEPRVDVFSCDAWGFEGSAASGERLGVSHVTNAQVAAHVREQFIRNVSTFSSRLPHTIERLSGPFFASWRAGAEAEDVFGRTVTLGGPLSFAYIDGDHTYAGSLDDFRNCDEFLEPGGFILFDDSSRLSRYGCRRTAREVAAFPRYELVMARPNLLVRKLRHA